MAASPGLLSPDRLALLRRRLSAAGLRTDETSGAERPNEPITGTDGALGTAERRMWKIYQIDPESLSHNIGLVLRFGRGYTIDTVVQAAEQMIRIPVLASTISDTDDQVRREPTTAAAGWVRPGSVWEAGQIPPEAAIPPEPGLRDDVVDWTARTFTNSPFALTDAPPFRMRVLAGPDTITVVFVVHHLAVDDTSWPLLLGTLTGGDGIPITADTPAASPHVAASPPVAAAVSHARATWAADDIRFPLSGQLPATTPEQSWLDPLSERDGIGLRADLDGRCVDALSTAAADLGATTNALYLAVTALSVYAVTGATDHVLLIPSDNRPAGASPASVGYCGNIIPVRFAVDPAGDVRGALESAVASIYRSMEFAGTDYGAILTALRTSGGRFPVVEVLASVRNAPLRGVPIPDGSTVSCVAQPTGIANYPLAYAFEIAADGGVHLELDHQPDVIDDAFAQQVISTTLALLQRIPSEFDSILGDLAADIAATH